MIIFKYMFDIYCNMTSEVTIKQKAHQNNPIALFIKDILAKNKNKFGIKQPFVIDFVDQSFLVGKIVKLKNGDYYIPISKYETLQAINPLKTKTKYDDNLMEYNIISNVFSAFENDYPNEKLNVKVANKHINDIFNKRIRDDVVVVKQDKRFNINQKEMTYIISRIKYFKNKMGIKKPIVVEINDTSTYEGGSVLGYAREYQHSFYLVIDYKLYDENRGNIIGSKGFDMFIIHELTHFITDPKVQKHGVEYKKLFKKYASEITSNPKVIKDWGNATSGSMMKTIGEKKSKHALFIPNYSSTHFYVDIKRGYTKYHRNISKFESLRKNKLDNKQYGQYYTFLNLPQNEKIILIDKLEHDLGIKKLKEDEYDCIVDYHVLKLYNKYGNKKYLPALKKTDNYKFVMQNYNKIIKKYNKKSKKVGKPSNRHNNIFINNKKLKL